MKSDKTQKPDLWDDALRNKELSRLLTAAVVNMNFQKMLLKDPQRATTVGFNGELFNLVHNEQHLIQSIKASSLADFALQLAHSNKKARTNIPL